MPRRRDKTFCAVNAPIVPCDRATWDGAISWTVVLFGYSVRVGQTAVFVQEDSYGELKLIVLVSEGKTEYEVLSGTKNPTRLFLLHRTETKD